MTQNNDKGSRQSSLLALTTVVGGIIGAVAGLLLAPQPGRETRNQLQKSYDNLVDNINVLVRKFDDTMPSFINKIKNEVRDLPEQIKDEIVHISKETEEKLNKVIETGTHYVLNVTDNLKTTISGKKNGQQ
ncbi:MAG: YtxH domain-containing protein [Candidatus Magnetoovum sp. WYHC-5]|nr:YtxH domain-containing protein [Candidatus Magnetoovum sp. WYHC-5]